MSIHNISSVDWSKYPPDRVEGLKLFRKGPTSDEDGPPSEEELKMMCLKWDCKVDMKIDNYLFWFMRKMRLVKFKGDEEKFQRYIPRIFQSVEKHAMESYNSYQQQYAEKNKEYLKKCLEWRKTELRRLRYLDKLSAICSRWSWSDDDDSDDDDTESSDENENSSVNTVIEIQTQSQPQSQPQSQSQSQIGTRFASYLETESLHVQTTSDENIRAEEVVETMAGDTNTDVNTQTFLPQCTSTQS